MLHLYLILSSSTSWKLWLLLMSCILLNSGTNQWFNLLYFLICNFTRVPSYINSIPFISWDNMHMEMEYSLACNFSIVLYNIQSFQIQPLFKCFCHFNCYLEYMGGSVVVQGIHIIKVFLWQDKNMSGRCWTRVKYYLDNIVFIKRIGRNNSICKLAEYAIIFFDSPSLALYKCRFL